MWNITNLQLAAASVIVGLVVAFGLFSAEMPTLHRVVLYIALLGIGGLIGVAADRVQKMLNENSVWRQPVTGKTGAILINSVVSVWLALVGLIFYLVVKKSEITTIALLVSVFLLGGIGAGKYLQRRFSMASLLPYGISFLGALVLVLTVFVFSK